MNFSDVFIRRPVATTLIILAIVIFGAMSYRQLPVSDLPTVDYPTIQVQASLPGREPGDDGGGRGHAAREAVLGDCRRRLDQLDQPLGQHQHHASSSRSTATSTPPRRTCSR